MSDLRIVRGNDFATLYTIRAMYSDGTVVEDFDLQSCTDVQVIVHRSYSRGVTSSLAANEYGSFSIEPENILRINWDGLLVKLGTYTVDFRAKFRGADIRSYSIKDLIFDIVETNEEANIPAGAFVDNGVYVFSGDFVLMFESQVQADWDESDTSSPAYIKNKPTIPSSLAELSEDAEHRTVTDAEIAEWNAKQDAIADIDEIRSGAAAGATAYQLPATGIPKEELSEQVQTSLEKADTAYQLPSGGVPYDELSQSVQDSLNKADTAYQKPSNGIPSTDMTSAVQSSLAKADTAYQKPPTGIPASDIASGVIPDVSQFITRSVNNLVNYYLKSETYTKAEVQGLIAAINQFHYEIYPSTSSVTNPQGNVLYLIGPTGTGADKYEEYVYANNTWVKIGDTSIDLSGYVTSDGLHDVFEQIYEDYAKKDGFYENMLVGSALNLTDTTGAYIAREFYYSPAGGTNDIKTGSAFIKKIKGSTIVWNQLVDYSRVVKYNAPPITVSNGVISIKTDTAVATGSGVEIQYFIPTVGHKYYFSAYVDNTTGERYINYRVGTNAIVVRSLSYSKGYIKDILTAENTNNTIIWKDDEATPLDWSISQFKIFDLTLMFGAGNEPATVAEFEAMFPLDYYDYNAGQLLSFTGDDIKTTGFNQWDEQWELGEINADTGANTDTSIVWRSKNYIPILPDTSYYAYCAVQGTPNFRARFYDANKNYIGYLSKSGQQITTNSVFTTPTNAHYLRFAPLISAIPTGTQVCFNISHNGTKNGTYEEYEQHIKDISFYKSIKDGQGNTLFPYGLLSAGSVYDEVTATKAIKRVGAVDMGSLTWVYQTASLNYWRFYAGLSGVKRSISNSSKANLVCPLYEPITPNDSYNGIKGVAVASNANTIFVCDENYTDAATLKAAMQGVMLYYELAEPVVVDITEQNMAYLVNDWGTEQLLPENTSAPVTTPAMLHVIYGMNAVDTLRNLPKNFLAQADLDRLLTAMGSVLGFTYTKSWSVDTQQWSFTITPVSTSLSLMQSVNDEPVDEYVEEGE